MASPSSPVSSSAAAAASSSSAAQQHNHHQHQVHNPTPNYMFHHPSAGSPTWNTGTSASAANSSAVYTPPMLQSQSGETSPYHQSLSAPGNNIATGEGNNYASGFLPPTPNSAVTTVGPNSGNSNDGHSASTPTNELEANHQLAALAQNNLYSHWASSGVSQAAALRASQVAPPSSLSPPTDLHRNGSSAGFLGLAAHHHPHAHHPYMNTMAPFTHHQQNIGQYSHKGYGMGHQQFNPWGY